MRRRSATALAALAAGGLAAALGVWLLGPGGTPPSASVPTPSIVPSSPPGAARAAQWPTTSLHYAGNGNLGSAGSYLPGADGFNLADVSTVAQTDALPAGVRALVWIGSCDGATARFAAAVDAFIGHPKLFGFYLMDEPYPSGCAPANLKAESDWVHAHVPGARTFVVLTNLGPASAPSYLGAYSAANTDLDLVGLDAYPVRSELASPDYREIARRVAAAEAAGWPLASLVPVYQVFGGGSEKDDAGGHWVLPTVPQLRHLLADWAAAVPDPVFDYVYSWGVQFGDSALAGSPDLRAVFRAKNASASAG
jgi:hypothetical protein